MKKFNARTIDEFILVFPESVRKKLEQIRKVVFQLAPEAEEAIRYGIPTFQLHGNLVHFAAYDTHIGFYPGPAGIDAFEQAGRPYRTGKGTLQFSLNSPLPIQLIRDILKFRIAQNRMKGQLKSKKKINVCPKGHSFVRSSSCPVCPTCDAGKKDSSAWSGLSAPARRALEQAGIHTLKDLSKWSEAKLLTLHGFGPSSLPKIRMLLRARRT